MNPYANSRVYGPYFRPDNRQHVICIFIDGTRKTVSYPKYLVEKSIGRILDTREEVHHINGDVTDNKLENLQIIDKTTHRKMHVKRYMKQDFLCPVCGTEFTLDYTELSNLVRNRKLGRSKTGPFCSKSCAGIGSTFRSEVELVYTSILSLQDENLEVDPANSEKPIINGNAELD